jgi:tetratricopeptide (TPR) repeat protein
MRRLGSFEFDPVTLTLVHGGEIVRVPRKTMELLALLEGASGGVVGNEALRGALWPEGFVEERNLSQHVYVLRHALAADPTVRVETLPRRGYRLVVSAESVLRVPWLVRTRLARWAAGLAAAVALATSAGTAAHEPGLALDPAAVHAYELGRLQWERRDPASLNIAERYFQRTIALAPRDARGYAGLASVEVIRAGAVKSTKLEKAAYARATSFAQAALARDGHSADAMAVLALVALNGEQDQRRADALFKLAQTYDPNNAYAHVWRGMGLYEEGRLEEARIEFARGAQLDPGSKIAANWLGTAEYNRGAFAAAAEQFRAALDLDPKNIDAALNLTSIDEARRDYEGALRRLAAFSAIIPADKRVTIAARLEALRGRPDEGRRKLATLRSPKMVDQLELAATQLALGDRRAALGTLHRVPKHEKNYVRDTLRWDVRFVALRRFALDAEGSSAIN